MDERVVAGGSSHEAPGVVLLHAGGLVFDADIPALSRLGRVVRYDRSDSGATCAGNLAIDRVGELLAVIERECGSPAVLVGSSVRSRSELVRELAASA